MIHFSRLIPLGQSTQDQEQLVVANWSFNSLVLDNSQLPSPWALTIESWSLFPFESVRQVRHSVAITTVQSNLGAKLVKYSKGVLFHRPTELQRKRLSRWLRLNGPSSAHIRAGAQMLVQKILLIARAGSGTFVLSALSRCSELAMILHSHG
jgi:hypothetical protein